MVAKPRHGRTTCRDCERHPRECGPLSKHGGLCSACQVDRMTKSARQLSAGAGPYYDQWVRGTIDHARQLDVAG